MEDIQKDLKEGKLKFYTLDQKIGAPEATVQRRRFLEERFGSLENIGKHSLRFEEIVGRNIEIPIGAVQIPLSAAGPITVKGDYAKGDFYIPLATTEGALTASVNRGVSAINASGGASVKILDDKMTRAPAFKAKSLREAVKLIEWVENNLESIHEVVEETSPHIELVRVQSFPVGRTVFLRLNYTTGDAAGMNMTTVASDRIAGMVEKETGIKCIALSGNMCMDKKPSSVDWILGRGKSVTAEAVIKRDVVVKKLKTTPEKIVETSHAKNFLGSARAGSLGGFNAHTANMIAACFIATGQDPAQVVESSMSITNCETEGEDLYISITLPSLEVGTVGGGTRLPCQSEALKIMECSGGGQTPGDNAKKLAEIFACAALAGELSLIGAISAGHLSSAHEAMGR